MTPATISTSLVSNRILTAIAVAGLVASGAFGIRSIHSMMPVLTGRRCRPPRTHSRSRWT